MHPGLLDSIATAIRKATMRDFRVQNAAPVGGGCINAAYRLEGGGGSSYFVKLNDSRKLAMFAAEHAGLAALAATRSVRVPQPVTFGAAGSQAFLVLEYLALNNSGNARQLGEQLAGLHRNTSARFGWESDNTIGATPQPNGWCGDWIAFWRDRRLGFQLRLAAGNGHGGRLQDLGQELMEELPGFFHGYTPQPSLLHGDLWGGNHAYIAGGEPAIFDPAPYYGDREADLAMTELFGGFDADFHAAYRAAWPLDAGYAARKHLYNLYHVLNHANLFGGGYVRQAEDMMQKLLACPAC